MASLLRVSIEVTIIAIALIIMIFVVLQTNKLLKILQGSKVESPWRQARGIQTILVFTFFLFAIVRVLATIDNASDSFELPKWLFDLGIGENHNLVMNSSFLLTALLLLLTIRVDIKAYEGLFKLLKSE